MATSTGIPFFSPSIEITFAINCSRVESKYSINSGNPLFEWNVSAMKFPSSSVFLLSVKVIVIPLFK